MQEATNYYVSPEFRLNKSQEIFGSKVKETGAADSDYKLKIFIPLNDFSSLTPRQKEHLDRILNQRREIRDSTNKLVFTTSISEIINRIKQIALEMGHLQPLEIEIVGSAVAAILESDPDYFNRFANKAIPSSANHAYDVPFISKILNDIDIRIHLPGWDKEKRLELSRRLTRFYTELAKKQSTLYLAHLVAIEYARNKESDFAGYIACEISKSQTGRSHHLSQKDISEIKRIIKKVSPRLERAPVSAEEKLKFNLAVSRVFAASKNKVIYDCVYKYAVAQFQGKIKNPRDDLERLACSVIKGRIFKKLCNPHEEKGDKYLIHGFQEMEFICWENLKRVNITTRDKPRYSITKQKLVQTSQSLADHTLGLVRLDVQVLDGIDFLKLMSFYTQGESPAAANDEARAFDAFFKAMTAKEDFLSKYLESHHSKKPLNTLCFIFNCAIALERMGKLNEKKIFLEKLKSLLPKVAQTKWEKFLLAILKVSAYELQDIVAILQTLAAIHIRRKIPAASSFEFLLRKDTCEPAFKMVLRAEGKSSYLHSPFKLENALRRTWQLVTTSPAYKNIFHDLYKHVLNEEDKELQFLALAEEYSFILPNDPASADLWLRVLEAHPLDTQRSFVVQRATSAGVWSDQNMRNARLYKLAPLPKAIEYAVKQIDTNLHEGWGLLHEVASAISDDDLPLLQSLFNRFYTQQASTLNLRWHLAQFKLLLEKSKLSLNAKMPFYISGVRKLLEISRAICWQNPENQIAEWLQKINSWETQDKARQAVDIYLEVLSLYPVTECIVTVVQRNLPPLLNFLRMHDEGLLIQRVLQACRDHNVKLPDNSATLLCLLEAHLATINQNAVKGEDVAILVKRISPIFALRNDHKMVELLDDYLLAFFDRTLELGFNEFAEALLSQNIATSIVRLCQTRFQVHLEKVIADASPPKNKLGYAKLFPLAANPLALWEQLLLIESLREINNQFPSVAEAWESFAIGFIPSTETESILLIDCWMCVLDAARKHPKLNLPKATQVFETLLKQLSSNQVATHCLLEFLLGKNLSHRQLSTLHELYFSKHEDVPINLECQWLLVTCAHPKLFKASYERAGHLLKRADTTTQNEALVDICVSMIIKSKQFAAESKQDGNYDPPTIKAACGLYDRFKECSTISHLRPIFIEEFGLSNSALLKRIALDQIFLHVAAKTIPKGVSSKALAPALTQYLDQPLSVLKPNLPFLHSVLTAPEHARKIECFIPAGLYLQNEFEQINLSHTGESGISAKTTAILELFKKTRNLCELALLNQKFQKGLFDFIKQLGLHGDRSSHSMLVYEYVYHLTRSFNPKNEIAKTTFQSNYKLKTIIHPTFVWPEISSTPAQPGQFKNELFTLRAQLLVLYIELLKSNVTRELSAFYLDCAYFHFAFLIHHYSDLLNIRMLLQEISRLKTPDDPDYRVFVDCLINPLVNMALAKGVFRTKFDDNDFENPLYIGLGLKFGLESYVKKGSEYHNSTKKLCPQIRESVFREVFDHWFNKMNSREVRLQFYRAFVMGARFGLEGNIKLYNDYMQKMLPHLFSSASQSDEQEITLAAQCTVALVRPLTHLTQEEKKDVPPEWVMLSKIMVAFLHQNLANKNTSFLTEKEVDVTFLALLTLMKGPVFKTFDETYYNAIIPFMNIVMISCAASNFSPIYEKHLSDLILGKGMTVDKTCRATRAKFCTETMRLALTIYSSAAEQEGASAGVIRSIKESVHKIIKNIFKLAEDNHIYYEKTIEEDTRPFFDKALEYLRRSKEIYDTL